MLADYNPNVPPITLPTNIPAGHLWQVMDWFAELLVANATGTYDVPGLSPFAANLVRNNCLQAASLIRKAADILEQNHINADQAPPQQAAPLSRFLNRAGQLAMTLMAGAGTAAVLLH